MRRHLLAGLLVAVWAICPAAANYLLLAPTGVTLTTGQYRAEAAFSPRNDEGKYFWLGTGFRQYELNVIQVPSNDGGDESLVGVQLNFIPETFLTPAVSFGLKDVASQSAEGIGVYVAITRSLPLSERSILKQFALTAGVGAAGIRGPFVGFQAELPNRFFAEGEYDSQNLNAAVGWEPLPGFKVKAYTIRGELYYGAQLARVGF